MQTDKEQKMRQKFEKLVADLDKWPEDRVKNLLQQSLESEHWTISSIALGTERGKDLVAKKGQRTIITEAKGEPKSLVSYQQERRSFIRGAFASIVQHMREDNPDLAYCIAFPNNAYYPRRVKEFLPTLVRSKLRLNTLFVDDDGHLDWLPATQDTISRLRRFDDLFSQDS